MDPTITDYATKVAQLITRAPAGGILHDAVLGPVRTFQDATTGARTEATFPVFLQAGVEFDVTIKPK